MDPKDVLACIEPSSLYMLLSLLFLLAGAWVMKWFHKRFERTVIDLGASLGSCGISGRAVARRLLDACGLPRVTVVESKTRDLYDPRNREVQLTSQIYQGATVAAVAIAAHEVGHAQQHASGSLVWRMAQAVRYLCWLAIVAAGLLMGWGLTTTSLTSIGPSILAICVVSLALQTAVVLPREIGASRRAKDLASQAGFLATQQDVDIFDRVLHSAAWTYVASLSGRWLGLIGIAMALLCVCHARSMLDGEVTWDSSASTAPGPFSQSDATVTLGDPAPLIFAAEHRLAGEATSSAFRRSTPTDGPVSNVPPTYTEWVSSVDSQLPLPLAYRLTMAIVSAVQWCGILGVVAVFLVLGRWQRKWTAPQDALKRNQAGVRHFERGRYEQAIRDFSRALKLDPKLSGGYCNRATAYQHLERWDEALADFESALKLHPGLISAALGQAQVWLQAGDRQRALLGFNEVLRLAPECTTALGMRGSILLDTNIEKAEADFELAISLGTTEPLPYWGRGVVWLTRGDYHRAIKDLNDALQLDPGFEPALRDRGLALQGQGNHQGAIADLNQALQAAPTDAPAC